MYEQQILTDSLKLKLFIKFKKFSYQDLARRIQKNTGERTTRFQLFHVFSGRMVSPRIRKALAELVNEPVENFWPKDRRSKKRSKRKDGTASGESQSIVNSEPDQQ